MSCFQNRTRVFRLEEFSRYPSTDCRDGVAMITAHRSAHLWLKTEAAKPTLYIFEQRFKPVRRVKGAGCTYVYMGKTSMMALGGYYTFKVQGVPEHTVVDDALIVAVDRQIPRAVLRKCETRDDLERAVWGLSRRDVGRSSVAPSRLRVGQLEPLILTYNPGVALPKGTLVRFTIEAFLVDLRRDSRFKLVQGRERVRFLRAEQVHRAKRGLVFEVTSTCPAHVPIALEFTPARVPAFPCAPVADRNLVGFDAVPGFILEVSRDKGVNYVSPQRAHAFEVTSGKPVKLELFLPGRRRPGESPSECVGVYTDRFGNPAWTGEGNRPRYELVLLRNGRIVERLGAASAFLIDHCRLRIPLPSLRTGLYRIRAEARDREVSDLLSNPMEISGDPGKDPVYWGGIHAHTEMSDGFEPFAEGFRRARDDAALDVAAVADHAGYFTENQWQWMQDVMDNWNDKGRFVTLIAFEWNRGETYEGRRSGFDILIYSKHRLPRLIGTVPLTEGFERLSKVPGVVLETHHSGDRVLDVWHFKGARKLMRLFEVCSVFGINEGAAGVKGLLQQGERFGVIGGGDSHIGYCAQGPRARPEERDTLSFSAASAGQAHPTGITGILASRLTRTEVLRAMKKRRVYGTTGARMLLDFTLSGVTMGGRGKADRAVVDAEVHGTAPIERLHVLRDGEVAHETRPGRLDAELTWTDPGFDGGTHAYMVKVIQEDGEQGWSSPVWLTRTS